MAASGRSDPSGYSRHDACSESHDGIAFIAGDRGASQWSYTHTDEEGCEHRVDGCDLYESDGDRIRVKDAYRRVHVDINQV